METQVPEGMQADDVQILGGEQVQNIEMDDIRMEVAPVNEAQQTQLPNIQMASEQLQTSVGKVSIAYLSKFVIPYIDAYEKMQTWSSKDIALIPLMPHGLPNESFSMDPSVSGSCLSPGVSINSPFYWPADQDVETPAHTVASLSPDQPLDENDVPLYVKKMSQHRLLQFLRFLNTFTNDFVSNANKIPGYRNNLIFRRLRKELFVSLKDLFGYRMAPNPFSSDDVFTAFFLFNVLIQLIQDSNWNPVTLPDHLTQLCKDRNAMKKLVVLCVKQYQASKGAGKESGPTDGANRYYICLQRFFKNDSLIVTTVHEIRDILSETIQTVTKYTEQRKAKPPTQKHPRTRALCSKKTPINADKAALPDMGENGGTPTTNPEADSSDQIHSNEEHCKTSSPPVASAPVDAARGSVEHSGVLSTSMDQAAIWLDDYLAHTTSGFYTSDDFIPNDFYLAPTD